MPGFCGGAERLQFEKIKWLGFVLTILMQQRRFVCSHEFLSSKKHRDQFWCWSWIILWCLDSAHGKKEEFEVHRFCKHKQQCLFGQSLFVLVKLSGLCDCVISRLSGLCDCVISRGEGHCRGEETLRSCTTDNRLKVQFGSRRHLLQVRCSDCRQRLSPKASHRGFTQKNTQKELNSKLQELLNIPKNSSIELVVI